MAPARCSLTESKNRRLLVLNALTIAAGLVGMDELYATAPAVYLATTVIVSPTISSDLRTALHPRICRNAE